MGRKRVDAMTGPRKATVATSPLRPLSERELEVVSHLTEGLTYAEIGRRMWLSHASVKAHVHRALEATGTRCAAQLCASAVRQGLVP